MQTRHMLPLESYFRFSTVWHNRLRNKHLTEYLRNAGNDLATVRFSAFCGAMLSNNSFSCKDIIFYWNIHFLNIIFDKKVSNKYQQFYWNVSFHAQI